ncbi:MAG TPA: hypothetical protein DEV81_03605 [Cyanobacteria bacterium UBA11049]|nr:hypothetical protein [Cyanobacteria bacterium UBA11049]
MDFISNSPISANYFGCGKSESLAVEFLFIQGLYRQESLGDRTEREQFGQINYDLGIAQSWLHSAAPRTKLTSGRYRYNAVPI